MLDIKKVSKNNISDLNKAAKILNACGKDMAEKYDLHHWDNLYIKSLMIVGMCALKNDVYMIYDGLKPVATFMTMKNGDTLHFEKLGTLPAESGKGIGSFCMTKIEESARQAGCTKVAMEVYEPSQHAISFYEHKGYKKVGTTDTLKYKEIKMEKSI